MFTPPNRAHWHALILFASILFMVSTSSSRGQVVQIADEQVQRVETAHPYGGGSSSGTVVWSHLLDWPDASYISVHFARFELAPGDTLVLSNREGTTEHRYTGRGFKDKGGDFWGLSISGSAMELTLISTNPHHQSFGLEIDRWAHGFPADTQPPGTDSLCGTEDFQDVECYQDTYPAEYEKARAVVRLIKNGSGHCTGWLVSCENHILTNEHCVASQAELDTIEIQFDYKRPACNSGTATAALQLHGGTLLEVDAPLDYALLVPQLDGNDPQDTFGFLQVETRLPDIDEKMFITHHPSGDPKRISIESTDSNDESGRCEVYSTDEPACTSGAPVPDIGYYCDTEGGSSGSPVISSETLKAIALHHCANCPNRGVPIVDVFNDLAASAHPLPACSTCELGLPASNLSATADGNNRIQLNWSPAADAVEYAVYRSVSGCAAGMALLATSPTTSHLDETASGGVTYSYQIRAVNDCGAEAEPSNCASSTTGGGCVDAPLFDGLVSATNRKLTSCSIRLDWTAGTAQCGTEIQYNIYRSSTAGFTPGTNNRIASCVAGTSFDDTATTTGGTYHYIVRAEDNSNNGSGACQGGNEDLNTEGQSALVTGPDEIFFSADFESSAGWVLEGEWEIGAPQGRGGSADSGSGNPDPTAAFAGSGILGVDLSGQGSYPGNYENNITAPLYATSPSFDNSAHAEAIIRLERWLGFERFRYDEAVIEVFDGAAWQPLWQNPDTSASDTDWSSLEADASEHLAGVPNARIRFGIESDGSVIYAGWNIDNLEILSGGSCTTDGATTASPVPDGRWVSGVMATAARSTSTGEVDLSWDVTGCSSNNYHLLYGDSDGIASYSYAGAVCDLSPTGTDTSAIPDPPAGHGTWWVIVGAEGNIESIHGYNSTGTVRPAQGTGLCGISEQSTASTCP